MKIDLNTSAACRRFGRRLALLSGLVASLVAPQFARAQAAAVLSGQKVAFLGGSITANGWSHPAGYVRLVVSGLKTSGMYDSVDAVFLAGQQGAVQKQMEDQVVGQVGAERPVITPEPTRTTLAN